MNQCAFYKLRSKKQLARYLKTDLETLNEIKDLIQYSSFKHKVEGKKDREITAPNIKLKRLQKRVHELLIRVERPAWLISGERGKSYIDNAKMHQHCNYALCMDIKSFYTNTKREYVFRFFTDKMLMSKDTAKILTDIVTYIGSIPTGSPASQLISYYAYHQMFLEIESISKKHDCIFSLYVDDMTFSSMEPIRARTLTKEIDIILRKHGHRPSYSKTKYYSKTEAKPITGVTLSRYGELLIPNSLHSKIKRDSELALKKSELINKNQLNTFRGRLQAARIVKKSAFPELNKFAKALSKTFDI
ncbi:reverse transcriptase family protein [Paenibacillus odorifer]|uniref:reverse transcriptase family protein n=1 Tax=Paenibacillus odorifer TaxID=189426 RepID=UPI0020BE77CF|nr:reverse transcriptase family protein [Paenibacillus odorifer]